MGTDIHAVWQAKKDNQWVDVPSTWDQDRHYALFAWLANVRNGYGFAGVPTHKEIKPIAEPRGLPNDFTMGDDERHVTARVNAAPHRQKWTDDDGVWMGDHSFSWLILDEILAAERPGTLDRVGVIDRAAYEAWDGVTPPESWCGDIAGRGIVVIDQPKNIPHTARLPEMVTHVRIRFSTPDGFDYFVNEVRRIREEHGPETRLVFGFDS